MRWRCCRRDANELGEAHLRSCRGRRLTKRGGRTNGRVGHADHTAVASHCPEEGGWCSGYRTTTSGANFSRTSWSTSRVCFLLSWSVVAGPLPDADALDAVRDGGIRRQPLRPGCLPAGDHKVDVVAAAQAVVHHRQQAISRRVESRPAPPRLRDSWRRASTRPCVAGALASTRFSAAGWMFCGARDCSCSGPYGAIDRSLLLCPRAWLRRAP